VRVCVLFVVCGGTTDDAYTGCGVRPVWCVAHDAEHPPTQKPRKKKHTPTTTGNIAQICLRLDEG